MPVWHGYVEFREIQDVKGTSVRALRAERLSRTPDVVLTSPDEVAAWITAQRVVRRREADGFAESYNACSDDRPSINRSLARQGRSVYASVRLSRHKSAYLAAEVVPR
ncbi:hypothetical protein [Goodfellowiella coeruleoviolacea]|uniref:Uncharacterized protein n=1 Tax=Goodfellowiella coeruleoviolacea TaxID=334858 RepID=A0AAE3GAP7_9PSEU|nr:hypothetical protein [Goodfellowiella coeruleoviolacea]MCP2164791.1 hypothetical protein [Goodfellowiella coeruleoviolacea]